jgi:hypothetical protein
MCDNTESSIMAYTTKCSICLSFIHTYSQVFNMVSSCQAADVPSVSDFVPDSMVTSASMVAATSSIRARSCSNLQEEVEQKLCL